MRDYAKRYEMSTSQVIEWALGELLGIPTYNPALPESLAAFCPKCMRGVILKNRCGVCGWTSHPGSDRERLSYNLTKAREFWALIRIDREWGTGNPPGREWMDSAALPNTHWIWTGDVDKDGYGIFTVYREPRRAQALAYEARIGGPVNDDDIDSTCGIRRCVRPEHLRARDKGPRKHRAKK